METHIPVLLTECLESLNIKPNGIYCDLTLGRGGHSIEIAKRLNDGKLICLDQDQTAIEEGSKRLSSFKNVIIIKSNFQNLKSVLQSLKIDKVDGILMDLGVSSPQFDVASRGFSYQNNGPLDMRMDQNQKLDAYQIVNCYSLQELVRIFKEYGDEKYAYSIAKNIVESRMNKPIETTFELVDVIKKSKPMKELTKIGHPAKQVFQALRIKTNDELNVLRKTIIDALDVLNKNGRLAIISFHSGEDRIVKTIFNSKTKIVGNRLNIPDQVASLEYRLVNKHPVVASEKEIQNNHRSKSAKLRVIEKI